jgi:transposase-like protein
MSQVLDAALQILDESLSGPMDIAARNMHKGKRKTAMQYRHKGKVVVMGLLERGGKVRTEIIGDRDKATLQGIVKQHVEPGTQIMSDELLAYNGLSSEYVHQVINHAVEYAKGQVHTNSLENFWSLVKRQLNGTYISVEPFHLFRYLDEQAFRYQHRATKDKPFTNADRFAIALSQVAGKRLTWANLTGKEEA